MPSPCDLDQLDLEILGAYCPTKKNAEINERSCSELFTHTGFDGYYNAIISP